ASFGHGSPRGSGLAAWGLMASSFQPMLRFYRRSPSWGLALPAIAAFYAGCTVLSAWQHGRGRRYGNVMDNTGLASGKGHRDENFPVASSLIKPEYRPPVMAYYRFARAADDVADHPTARAAETSARSARSRAGSDGDGAPEAMALRAVMAKRSIDPVNAHDSLNAFERDVTVNRYADWDDSIGYCRYSAMPVGRFVLDVHGESRATWAANDASCAALQIVNHSQDCGKDYRTINRVYIPLDTGSRVED
ncbi:hypothetical protein OY671_008656, partial [Metschnikowia pulcherrima]